MRGNSLKVCQLIAERFHKHVLEGSLTKAMLKAPLSLSEFEETKQEMIDDADLDDKAFIT